MNKTILIALGGNALLQSNDKGTAQEQISRAVQTADNCLSILKEGYNIVITHGNGPQVGAILLKNEIAKNQLPAMPLDVCGAESQGQIGYLLQKEIHNSLEKAGMKRHVVSLLTQVLVNHNDPAFENPQKPIGPFYNEEEATVLKEKEKWKMVYQYNKGYRRVVPSPKPIDIIEKESIKKMIDSEAIVIACGGGGIPVIRKEDGTLTGIEAVIDKDLTAAVLGKVLGVHLLLILTDIEKVALNFGKEDMRFQDKMTVTEAKKYLDEGQFGEGSMKPKVEAACHFLENGGEKVIIASLDKAKEALEGSSGTTFIL